MKQHEAVSNPKNDRNRALEPATEVFSCRCDKPECEMRRLVSFRDHMAYLFNALVECEGEGLLLPFTAPDGSVHTWREVNYPIQMAAALEEVTVDTAYVDVSMSWMMCGGAADFEDAHSRVAEQYFAAAITFNFLWSAYEAAIRVAARTDFANDKTAVRGRNLAALISQNGREIPVLPKLTRGAERFCRLGGGLERELSTFTRRNWGAEAAAELARILRNHIAHGRDEVPLPSNWGPENEAIECGRIYRIYAVSRSILMLIQLFAIHSLTNPDDQIHQSWFDPDEDRSAVDTLTHLHLSQEALDDEHQR
jgi:hypothetical protein